MSAKRQNAYLVKKVLGELELDAYTLFLDHSRCSVNNCMWSSLLCGRKSTSLRAMVTTFRFGLVTGCKVFNKACPIPGPPFPHLSNEQNGF